jgi:aspartate aminotransferase-like enzyme
MARRHLTIFDLRAAALDTSLTLWFRWPILMAACWSHSKPQDAAELRRMVTEKMFAAAQGAMHAQLKLSRLALTGRLAPKDIGSATASIASAAVRPALQTVKANAGRLRKRRRK